MGARSEHASAIIQGGRKCGHPGQDDLFCKIKCFQTIFPLCRPLRIGRLLPAAKLPYPISPNFCHDGARSRRRRAKRSSEALLWSLTHANEREPIVGADACAAPSGHHAPPAIRHLPALSNAPCGGAWRFGHCWLNLRCAPRPQTIPLPREVRGQAFRAHRGCGSHVERGHSCSGALDRQHLHEGATTARLQFAADRGAARTHARTCTVPPLSLQASTLRSTRSTQSRMSSARMRSSCGGRAR